MYYLWSLIVTIIIFAALQYKEYQQTIDNKTSYNMFTFGNLSILLILYLVFTIMFYMLLGIDYDCLNKIDNTKSGKSKGGHIDDYNVSIDSTILRRIPDQMYTGFSSYDTEL